MQLRQLGLQVTATPTALRNGGCAGTATAALTFGGAAPGNVDVNF